MRGIKLSLVAMVLLAGFMLVLIGCGRKGLINVNGDKISKDEFYARLEQMQVPLMQGGRQVNVPAGELVIGKMIEEKLKQQLAKEEKVAPTDAQIEAKLKYLKARSGGEFAQQLKASGTTQEEVKRQIRIEQSDINLKIKGVKVTDAEVKNAYDKLLAANPSPLKTSAQVHISLIIAKGQDKINNAYKLLQDKQEFGTVAMRLSEAPSKANGGSVPTWFSMDMLRLPKEQRPPAQIVQTAFATPVGDYSKPIFIADKGWLAWVIVKTDQTRKATTKSFDSVKVLLREQLALSKADAKQYNDMIRKYISKSNIKVNAERYKRIPDMMKKNASASASPQTGAKPATPTAAPK